MSKHFCPRKVARIVLASTILFGVLSLDARIFTSNTGDQIEGEFLSASPTNANIKLVSGKVVAVPLSTFCDKDRLYITYRTIATEAERNKVLQFRIQATHTTKKSTDTLYQIINTWSSGYKVNVENLLSLPIGELTIQYGIFKLDSEEGAKKTNAGEIDDSWGQTKIDFIDVRNSFDFETIKMPMSSSKLKSGVVWAGGGKRQNSDALRGIWIRAYWKDLLVAEFKSSSRMDNDVWADSLRPPKISDQSFKE